MLSSTRSSGIWIGVSIGSHSCTAALKAYGGIRRIAFLSPYYPVANEQVARYFSDFGFAVVRDVYLACPSWTAIAEVTPDALRRELTALDGDDIDAIIQVGDDLAWCGLPRTPSYGWESR